MNIRSFRSLLKPRRSFFWLLVSFCTLSAIYFGLTLKADDTGQFTMSVLFYFCLTTLIAEKFSRLSINYDVFSIVIGIGLSGWIFIQAVMEPNDYIVRLFPFVSGLGIGLIAFGRNGLTQISRELLLLFFLGVPSTFCYYFIDISPITAKAAALILWYSGQNIWTQGTEIGLIGGKAISVVYDCSGIDMVNYFLALSILCLVQFPLQKKNAWFWIPAIGIIIGFMVNCLRVVMLVLFNDFNQTAFKNWHTGTGSYTFAMSGAVILGIIYWLFLNHDASKAHNDAA